jgi:hypothetical protein
MEFQERIQEITSFLQFVTLQWPTLRPQVADQLAKRCSQCILSERCSPLQGSVCEQCRTYQSAPKTTRETATNQEETLAGIFREYANRGKGDYDAVVLFSGGKDSAYLLYRLRNEFAELRVAALTVDNSFMSQVALANCRSILAKLTEIDHFILRPKTDLYARAFRYALTHLDGSGCYEKVDRMDGDLTFDIGRNFAAQLKAPLLISGLSPEQAERILGLKGFESPAEVEAQRRIESAGVALDKLYNQQELDRYWWNPARWNANEQLRVLHPFHAWNYDEEFIPREVVRLGLVEPGRDNPLITNNDTIPVMLAVDTVKLGYSSFEPEFAQLVRSGRADRAAWLAMFESIEYLTKRGEFLPRCVADTLNRLGLKHREIGLPPGPSLS